MKSYFVRHTDLLDIDTPTRQGLWDERIFGIHFPEDVNGVIGETDNESIDPLDYPPGRIQNYFRVLHEISRDGGYVLAEHHGHSDYQAGRVDPGTPIELIRGTWGHLYAERSGSPAVLRGFHLQDVRIVARDEISDLLEDRPPRGTLHRWHKAGTRLARLIDGADARVGEINQDQRAYHVWNELSEYARARHTVTYGMLGKLTGIHHRALRYPLEIIEIYCLENALPPLTILVVDQDTSRPRAGFVSWDVSDFEGGIDQVYTFDWASYRNPFSFAANGTRREELERQLLADPSMAKDVYALAKVRGTAQMLFRGALMRAYGGACAICGSTLAEGLEAAHLIAWKDADVSERLSVRNGLLLTSWHHRLFDAGLITITEDYVVRVNPQGWKNASAFDRARLEEIDGAVLRIPSSATVRPDPDLIRRRNARFTEPGAPTEV